MATGDKYDPVIIPYCKPTSSHVLILQSCPLLSPQSEDDYQTPPENVVDLDHDDTEEILDEIDVENIVTEEASYDTELIESQSPQRDAHHVLDEMHQREQQEGSKTDAGGKRKLPVSLENSREEGECSSSRHLVFKETINRVFTMLVAEGNGEGRDDGKGVDFLDTAKKKGMTFPRPRWRSPQTWKGL